MQAILSFLYHNIVMSRTKKDPEALRGMCERFVWLTETALGLRPQVLADTLGYANATTITKIRQGEAFPDPERLRKLAEIRAKNGSTPNLHWVITGEGLPLIGKGSREIRKSIDIVERIVQMLGPRKIKALEELLRHEDLA